MRFALVVAGVGLVTAVVGACSEGGSGSAATGGNGQFTVGAGGSGDEVIPADELAARASEMAADLALPEGYDLRVDLITPSAIGSRTLETALRFRAVCAWAHDAVGSGADVEAWSAAADNAAALVSEAVIEPATSQYLYTSGILDALEGGDGAMTEDFLAANCRGQGLAGYS